MTLYWSHARGGEDGLANVVLVLRRVLRTEVEDGGFALGAGEGAHGVDGDELAAALAVLDDAADTEGVVEDGEDVADFFAGADVVVDDDVVGARERGRRRGRRRGEGRRRT